MRVLISRLLKIIGCSVVCLQLVMAEELQQVIVRDFQSHIVSQFTSKEKLQNFTEEWNRRTRVTSNEKPKWKYKLHLQPGDTWFYDPEGWVQVLSIKTATIYKIEDPKRFNELIGIAE